jgi:hypothetical protein
MNISFFNLSSRLVPSTVELNLFNKVLRFPHVPEAMPMSHLILNRVMSHGNEIGEPPYEAALYRHLNSAIQMLPIEGDPIAIYKELLEVPMEQHRILHPALSHLFYPAAQTPVYIVHEGDALLGYHLPGIGGPLYNPMQNDLPQDRVVEPQYPRDSTWIDFLGIFSTSDFCGMKKPFIYISLEKIYTLVHDPRFTSKVPTPLSALECYRYLSAAVLVHEMAHAMMWWPAPKGMNRTDDFEYVEESLANYIMLLYFSRPGFQDPLEMVKGFITLQSESYQGGLLLSQAFGWDNLPAIMLAHIWKLVKARDYHGPEGYGVTINGAHDFRFETRYANGNPMVEGGYSTAHEIPYARGSYNCWQKPVGHELHAGIDAWKKLCHTMDGSKPLTNNEKETVKSTFLKALGISTWLV